MRFFLQKTFVKSLAKPHPFLFSSAGSHHAVADSVNFFIFSHSPSYFSRLFLLKFNKKAHTCSSIEQNTKLG